MYTATVQITIAKFAPISYTKNTFISATLAPPKNTSATGSGGSRVFKGNGQSIVVSVPKAYAGAVQITYQLPDPNYVLLGLAMKPTNVPGAGICVGRSEFRSISISRDTSGSQMVVTDACLPQFNQIDFNYVILVEAATGPNAGKIGLIDPDIDNEPGD